MATRRNQPARGAHGRGASKRGEQPRRRERSGAKPPGGERHPGSATQPKPMPYRVTKWGRFTALEPLFADERTYLIAKGGRPVQLDQVVLAVPSRGERRTVVEVLGTVDDLDAVLVGMLAVAGIPRGFDDDVQEEAVAVRGRSGRVDAGRRDLTGLAAFTIDPDTARDFDDAISVRRDGDGYRAHVHIADVSYFVDDDGAIEAEARRRTSSVYLPLFAEPMLPSALSSDVCSLVPRESRKCLTVEFTFDAEGRRTTTHFYRSLIRSDHRLTYGFVDTIIGPDEAPPPATREAAAEAVGTLGVPGATTHASAELIQQLRLAAELAEVLRRRRQARGALTLGSFEPEYAFDHAGELSAAVMRPETPSHALVEEFMLVANEAVAEFLLRKKAKTLYRVHEPPAAASMRELLDALEELDIPTPAFPEGQAVQAGDLAEAFAAVARIVAETSAREGRGRWAWSTLLLRSLKQARYAPVNLGHFGLASPAYLHFTSPIRRYPDLVTHRSLLLHLGETGSEMGEAEIAAAGEDCSRLERDISRLELKADDVALCVLLERRLGKQGWDEVFSGEIIGLIGAGLFIRFGEVFEGFLSCRRLGGERFEPSPHSTALIGQQTGLRYRLGDTVDVKVERVDRLRGRVDLALFEQPEATGRRESGPSSGRTDRGRGRPPRRGGSTPAARRRR